MDKNEVDVSTMTEEEGEAWALQQIQLKVEEQKLRSPTRRFVPNDPQAEQITLSEGGQWVRARSLPAPFWRRVKNAWLVVLGKAEIW